MGRRTMLRGSALAAGGALLGGAVGALTMDAAFAAGAPKVYSRSDWRARSPKVAIQVLDRAPTHIVVHHTATSNTSDTSKSHAAALSRAIQRHHMDTNGWSDTGQQLTISRGGHVMEGRDRSLAAIRDGRHVLGAHTANHNSHTIGIENEGLYTSEEPPEVLFDALADTCAWLCSVYGLDPSEAIVGHRDYNATACPGDELYAMLPRLRRKVRYRLDGALIRLSYFERRVVAPEELPGYPPVPEEERRALFYHGPAWGRGDVPS
ncbi:peptidoglycan recognition family protein [Nocardiopsis sp. LOL_012]|uniref:peptidoglycan recognition protein family protein n=1 Tax=Nocardiopsis sp. LOL_012 TaxID=3345409 RepID=UPI003A8C4997